MDRPRPPSLRAQWVIAGAVLAVSATLARVAYTRFPALYDVDAYYHLAVARAYAERGFFQTLDWARLSYRRDRGRLHRARHARRARRRDARVPEHAVDRGVGSRDPVPRVRRLGGLHGAAGEAPPGDSVARAGHGRDRAGRAASRPGCSCIPAFLPTFAYGGSRTSRTFSSRHISTSAARTCRARRAMRCS